MNAKEITKNDRIQTVYGDWFTVQSIYDNIITVYESNNTVHISKVIKHEKHS